MSKKLYISTAAAAAAMAVMIVPVASADEITFTDVSEKYERAVAFLFSNGITEGSNETKFGTETTIKRIDAAVLIARTIGYDESKKYKDAGFTDVPKRAEQAVNLLVELGVVDGKTKTKFGSDDKLTRNEAAKLLASAGLLDVNSSVTKTKFTDVNKRFAPFVSALIEGGITQGKSETKFGAEDLLKRGELALFIDRAKAHFGFMDLMVMHMNDSHAYLDNFPYVATAVKETREKNKNNVLLHAGDVFAGDLYFNTFKGKADVELMNYLGFDAMTFGNHEFDLGSTGEGHQALADFVKAAKFPLLTANIDFSKDKLFEGLQTKSVSKEYEDGQIYNGVVKDVNGEKVGVFGLTTEETPFISSVGSVAFSNYIEEAKAAVKAFEEQGVDKIIALTHIGFDDALIYDNDKELAKLVEGIDIIVGGHTHSSIAEPYVSTEFDAPTVIVQANEYAKYLGTLDVTFNQFGEITLYQGKLLSTDASEGARDKTQYEADPKAMEILKPFADKIEEIKKESIGVEALVKLDASRDNDSSGTPSIRHSEMNLGNLIADGMLYSAKTLVDENAVIALQNGGGIRTSIEAGAITTGDVLKVLPFGNGLATVKLTGTEIIEVLEHSVAADLRADGGLKENGAFLQVAGMKFTYDSSKEVGKRVQQVSVKNGTDFESLNNEKEYIVATNIFTAKGGDGFATFKKAYEEGRVSEPGFLDYKNLIEYMTTFENGVEPKVDGRIINVNATEKE